MGTTCVACGENYSSQSRSEGISFHRFPLKKEALCQQWVSAIKRDAFKPSKWSKLCSLHFTEDCFVQMAYAKNKSLKYGAVPSVFFAAKQWRNLKTYTNKKLLKPTQEKKSPNLSREIASNKSVPDSVDVIKLLNSEVVVPLDLSSRREESTTTSSAVTETSNSELIKFNKELRQQDNAQRETDSDNFEVNIQDLSASVAETSSVQTLPVVAENYVSPNYQLSDTNEIKRKKPRLKYFGDYTDSEMECAENAKNCRLAAIKLLEEKNRALRVMQQRDRRRCAKMKTLNELVQQLCDENRALTQKLANQP